MPKRNDTDPEAIQRAQDRDRALAYRLEGMTYEQIGERMGSKSRAHRLVTEAIDAISRDNAELVVDMELRRLDAMLAAIWPDVLDGDLKALDRVLRIMDRRARYYALDQRAVLALATNTKSLSAFDDFAREFLGRNPTPGADDGKLTADQVTADHIDDL